MTPPPSHHQPTDFLPDFTRIGHYQKPLNGKLLFPPFSTYLVPVEWPPE